MTAALDKWTDMFSDLPLFSNETFASTGERDDNLDVFKLGVAYHVTVARANVVKSDYSGDVQIEVDFTAEGFRPKKIWYTLPMQETDLKRDAEQVKWITQRRMRDVEMLYACAIPSMYALYDTVTINGPEKTFVGVDGATMDKDAFDKRRKVLQHNLTEVVKELHGKVGSPLREVEGTALYLLMNPNEKRPKYPYVNIYRTPPLNKPLWRKSEYDAPEGMDNSSVPF